MPGPASFPASSPAIRIRKGETIIALAWSNTATQLLGRFRVLYDDGTEDDFIFPQTLLTNNRLTVLLQSGIAAIRSGWILSGQIQQQPGVANQATQRGQCYVRACVVSAAGVVPGNVAPTASVPECRATICAGYVYSGVDVCVGQLIEPGPTGGAGAITRVSLATIAGGGTAGKVLAVVPVGALWNWIYGGCLYTASGTVGTRNARLGFRDGSGNVFAQLPFAALTAGQLGRLETASNLTSDASRTTGILGGANQDTEGPSPNRGLPATYDLFVSDLNNVDVTDTVALEAQVEEWVMPN